jgi:hypothetical protein
MTQADRVYITPPTNTSAIDHPTMFPPRDPTRRRFLAVTAIASVVSVGTLSPAAAMDPSVLVAVTVPRHSRPDPVFGMIEAHRRASAAHGIALVEQARLEQIGDLDAAWSISEQPCHDEFNAFDALLSAEAITVPGIVAQFAYLQEIAEHNAWMFSDREDSAPRLLKGFAIHRERHGGAVMIEPHTETAQIFQFADARQKFGKKPASQPATDRPRTAAGYFLKEDVSETCKNARLRNLRHDNWRKGNTLRDYWSASIKMMDAIERVQRHTCWKAIFIPSTSRRTAGH